VGTGRVSGRGSAPSGANYRVLGLPFPVIYIHNQARRRSIVGPPYHRKFTPSPLKPPPSGTATSHSHGGRDGENSMENRPLLAVVTDEGESVEDLEVGCVRDLQEVAARWVSRLPASSPWRASCAAIQVSAGVFLRSRALLLESLDRRSTG
jgi:hypothetical protein